MRRNGQDPDSLEFQEREEPEPSKVTDAIPQDDGEIFSLSQVTKKRKAEAMADLRGE